MLHAYDTRNKSDLFITNHNTQLCLVSLTMVCLFITTYLMKLSVDVYNET
jgi:hypothetical protein